MYDLAIIILDQCSRVFFDRTQPTDLQPQVMDSFANAIGRVVSDLMVQNGLKNILNQIDP